MPIAVLENIQYTNDGRLICDAMINNFRVRGLTEEANEDLNYQGGPTGIPGANGRDKAMQSAIRKKIEEDTISNVMKAYSDCVDPHTETTEFRLNLANAQDSHMSKVLMDVRVITDSDGALQPEWVPGEETTPELLIENLKAALVQYFEVKQKQYEFDENMRGNVPFKCF